MQTDHSLSVVEMVEQNGWYRSGEWTGFPEPVLEIRLLVNGSPYSRYNFHNPMYWAARSQQTETDQIAVRARNAHGTSEEVLSNVVSFVE